MSRIFAVASFAVLLTFGGGLRLASGDASGGSLLIESDPSGAVAYVDGRLAGHTPLTMPAIAAGVHRVRLVSLGYLENTRLVTVKAGSRTQLRTTLTSPGPQNAASRAALKIVALEGEGAVNVIQQKTATAPVIEVRDQNDLPVSGAVVRFAIRGGRATFSGGRTLSVTTDLGGRAAATGFAPTSSGALQITATATFQGQTAAVTIAQTTVTTAAQAAAVSGASAGGGGLGGGGSAAGGGGAGGGGGLSTTTLAIVGGAAAAGAVVVNHTLFAGTTFTGQFSGVLPDTQMSAPGFGNFSCTQLERQTGTIKITLDKTEGALSGTMGVEGDIAISPGTCQASRNTDSFGLDRGTVTGSPDTISATGHAQNDYSEPSFGGGGVNAYDFTFTGRLDGDRQITGSLTVARNVTFRSTDGRTAVNSFGTVTYQVTLQR